MLAKEIEKLYLVTRRLAEIAQEAALVGDHYQLMWCEGPSALGVHSVSGRAAIVLSVGERGSGIGRITLGLQLRQIETASFEFMGRFWESPAIVIECRVLEFMSAFVAFAAEVIAATKDQPVASTSKVLQLFEQWEQLFAGLSRLDASEELGLWGELWLIMMARDKDAAVAAWIADRSTNVDFLSNGIGLEVKTTRVRLRHHVSLAQADEPTGTMPSYVASLWCENDPVGGVSLPALIDQIGSLCVDSLLFEKKLMVRGYGRGDSVAYSTKFLVLEGPTLFPSSVVPRIREMDVGISHVRYNVTLDEAKALTPNEAASILEETVSFGR